MSRTYKFILTLVLFWPISPIIAEEMFVMVTYAHWDGKPFIFNQSEPRKIFNSKEKCEQELIRIYLNGEAQAFRVVREHLVVANGLGGSVWNVKGCIQIEKEY